MVQKHETQTEPLALSFKTGNNCDRVNHERGHKLVELQESNHFFYFYHLDIRPLCLVVMFPTHQEALGSISGFAMGFFSGGELFHRLYRLNMYYLYFPPCALCCVCGSQCTVLC